jgi:hypothetical protein
MWAITIVFICSIACCQGSCPPADTQKFLEEVLRVGNVTPASTFVV